LLTRLRSIAATAKKRTSMAYDLDHLPRFRFHPQRDKIVTPSLRRTFEGEVVVAAIDKAAR
jgi:hypothetical protein